MTFSGSQLTAFDAPLLGVNIDHVATLRNARGGRFPDPVAAALLAVGVGAASSGYWLAQTSHPITCRCSPLVSQVGYRLSQPR